MNHCAFASLTLSLLLACHDTAPTPSAHATVSSSEAWLPLAATEPYADQTLDAWATAWMRWSYAQTSCDDPAYDEDGSLCALYQDPDSPVFFLQLGAPGTQRTRCIIPRGKAIVVPMDAFANDNAGVDPPLPDSDLLASVVEVKASMRDQHVVADGLPVVDVERRGVGPIEYDYWVPPAPNWFTCNGIPDVADRQVKPSYFAGYFALFPPPSAGRHTLEYAGVATLDEQVLSLNVVTTFDVED
jgi:hypothetical protein